MATASGSVQPTAARSGGKIVTTNRRRRRQCKPYERPPPPPPAPPSRSPSWLSGLIVPAAKILYSVFNSSSSSFSSSSDADADAGGDSGYEDDANNDNDHNIPSYEFNEPNLELESSSERMKCMSKEPRLSVRKSERKHVIEQLLMQETFSREECDRLVNIVQSRVVGQSFTKMGENVIPTSAQGKTVDKVAPDFCNEAVMEAKRWLKERKAGQSPGSDISHGVPALYSPIVQDVESEIGSPLDMAKSYMRARPPWLSPYADRIELRMPSAMMTQLSGEGKSYSVSDNSFSPSAQRSLVASGAWNIQDEIRRVHSKATEDVLQPSPSTKNDMSLFSQPSQARQKYLVTDKIVARAGDSVNELNSLVETKLVDEEAELAAASEFRQGVVDEASLSNQATYVPAQNQDSVAFQTEGGHAITMSHHSASNNHAAEQHTDTNSGSKSGSTDKEVKGTAEPQNANGLPLSQARLSLSAEGDMGENHRHSTKENLSTLSHGNSSNGIPVEDRCELLTEASVEIPIPIETDDIACGLNEGQNQLEGNHELTENCDGTPAKQEGKRPSRNAQKSQRKR